MVEGVVANVVDRPVLWHTTHSSPISKAKESLNRDKLSSGVIANDIRRSTMHREIANLLIDSVITLDDLDGFTEDIKSYTQHWIGQ